MANRYLKTIMLSLFFMNLFPLSFLDGGQVLQAAVDLALKDTEKTQDLEARGGGLRGIGGGSGIIEGQKNIVKNSVEVGTWVLMAMSSTLALARWYRS